MGQLKHHRPMHAMEQSHPELLLEQLDLMAHRRGGLEQFLCCERKRRQPCCGLERLYRLEGGPIVHCNIHMS